MATINDDGTITVTLPDITSAAFSVNPVNTQGLTVISVGVTEIEKILSPEWYYSDDIFSGEPDNY